MSSDAITLDAVPGPTGTDRRRRNRVLRIAQAVGWIAFAVMLVLPVLDGSRYIVYVATLIAFHAGLAVSLNLLLGYAGQFAMSHAAFFGFGAYAAAILVSDAGMSFWMAMPLAVVIAAVVAMVIGYPAMRYTGGIHLALLTFAFGELARLIAANWHSVTGGPMGYRILFLPDPIMGLQIRSALSFYTLAVVLLLITLGVVWSIKNSRFGRALIAIREDETLASFLGINVVGHKLAAYMISSALAAMMGTAYGPFMSFVSPDLMSAHETISMIGVLILGGLGTVAGPIVGTLVFYGLPEFLRLASFYRLVILGVVIILVVLLMPKGVAGVIRERMERYRKGGRFFGKQGKS